MTGFPEDRLLADPESVSYAALGFKKNVFVGLLSPRTPISLAKRVFSNTGKELKDVFSGGWLQRGLWNPPKSDQALQVGGTMIFDGRTTIWRYYDPATADHADPEVILEEALKGLKTRV